MEIRFTGRTAFLLIWDCLSTFLSYLLASLLTGQYDDVFATSDVFFAIGIAALITVAMFASMHLYNDLWEYASVDDALRILLAVAFATLLSAVVLFVAGIRLPIRVFVGALVVMVFLAGGMRMLYRVMRSKGRVMRSTKPKEELPRTLVVGAGETGSLAISRMTNRDPLMPGLPVVAVDDNPDKRGLRIHGVRVAGGTDDICRLVERYDIQQIVVAIPSATLAERRHIYDVCTQTNCELKTLPNVRELSMDEIEGVTLREVNVADLLGRDEVVLNTRLVSGYISGKTILVTGGGGSIGSELVRQLCVVAPARVVVFDMYENDAYLLKREMNQRYDDVDVIVEIGNVCDEQRLREVFEKYRPAAVFHAAAHKHVPLMEQCPREAIRNNVFGTLNTVRLANEFGVGRFIFISTDKAVNPTSVMGATKRMGEMIIQHYAQTSKTVFAAVRFGNVLGSNGSVIPIFQKQIAEGGPVTVTDPNIERFFMTIPEAARLVIQAGGLANGGEVFILDMGDPVKIVDLARGLIQLSGLRPDKDIKIVYTGLRPGEKMYEELLMNEENTIPTKMKGIMVSTGKEVSFEEVEAKLVALDRCLGESDAEAIETLSRAVPTYTYTPNAPGTVESAVGRAG